MLSNPLLQLSYASNVLYLNIFGSYSLTHSHHSHVSSNSIFSRNLQHPIQSTSIFSLLFRMDWVLSHRVHFTVHSLDLFMFIWVYFVLLFFILHMYVVLLSAQWGGPSGTEAWSLGLLFLQCFDTVGWVCWPIKPVPDMTYNVFGGTLNPAQLNSTLKYANYLEASRH